MLKSAKDPKPLTVVGAIGALGLTAHVLAVAESPIQPENVIIQFLNTTGDIVLGTERKSGRVITK